MALTRKHYEAIAQIMANQAERCEKAAVVEALADLFQQDNPLFQREKFLSVCENQAEKHKAETGA